jgi:hypothetical protein
MPSSKEIRPTLGFVDEYCQQFEELFPEVRSFEAFKFLHLGMVSDIKRKSLPAIAKAVGLDNSQSLRMFCVGRFPRKHCLAMPASGIFSSKSVSIRVLVA